MATKKELIKECESLGIKTEGLTYNEIRAALKDHKEKEAEKEAAEKAAAEKAAAEKEAAEKAAAEKAAAEKAAAEKEAADKAAAEKAASKKSPKSYKDDRGRVWKFKKNAPKTINIDGHPMTQEEILGSEEVIAELVYGNSSFLTQ